MRKIIIFLFLIILSFNLVSGLDKNQTLAEENALSCLTNARNSFNFLMKENFSLIRANDSLQLAENSYTAQVALKQKASQTDFYLVMPYCQEVSNIKEEALKARDSFLALSLFYNQSKLGDINFSSVDSLILEIQGEIESERYEQVQPLVDKTYNEIINIKSSSTALNLFYESTKTGLVNFILRNWITIAIILAILFLGFIIYKKKISKMILERKIKHLETKKIVLRKMISKLQEDYFQYGRVAEGTYNIKTKKFAELIRDIDRQIPLLREELAKLGIK